MAKHIELELKKEVADLSKRVAFLERVLAPVLEKHGLGAPKAPAPKVQEPVKPAPTEPGVPPRGITIPPIKEPRHHRMNLLNRNRD